MPLGKYYCDYCDKEFQDSAGARKRHLQGIQHQRNRSLWYESQSQFQFRSINNEQDQRISGVCHRYVKTEQGSCPLGDSCRYAHPKLNVENHLQGGAIATGNGTGTVTGDSFGPSLGLSLGNHLPPSLRPPPPPPADAEGTYPHPYDPLLLPFVDWG